MQNVVLTVHLILALLLIGTVLLQRNEGGALLQGGGSMTARGAANALTKLTWILAAAFIVTSITMTVLAARNAAGSSVIDQIGGTRPAPVTAPAPDIAPAPVDPNAPIAPPAPTAAPATGAPAAAPEATAPAAPVTGTATPPAVLGTEPAAPAGISGTTPPSN